MLVIIRISAVCLVIALAGCIDSIVDTRYQRVHMPEIVNATQEAVDVVLVFKNSGEDGLRKLYHVRVPVHDSLPVWLDNNNGPAYIIGSYANIVEEVLVVRAGDCSQLLERYREEGSGKYDTSLSQKSLTEFLSKCPALVRVSGARLEAIRRNSGFYPKDATCLMLSEKGVLTPVRESDLPWYESLFDNVNERHLKSICAAPGVSAKAPLF